MDSVGPFNIAVYRCLGVAIPALSIIIYRGEVRFLCHCQPISASLVKEVYFQYHSQTHPVQSDSPSTRQQDHFVGSRSGWGSLHCCPVLWDEAHAHRWLHLFNQHPLLSTWSPVSISQSMLSFFSSRRKHDLCSLSDMDRAHGALHTEGIESILFVYFVQNHFRNLLAFLMSWMWF